MGCWLPPPLPAVAAVAATTVAAVAVCCRFCVFCCCLCFQNKLIWKSELVCESITFQTVSSSFGRFRLDLTFVIIWEANCAIVFFAANTLGGRIDAAIEIEWGRDSQREWQDSRAQFWTHWWLQKKRNNANTVFQTVHNITVVKKFPQWSDLEDAREAFYLVNW